MNVSQLTSLELMTLRNAASDLVASTPHDCVAYSALIRICMACGIEFMTRMYDTTHASMWIQTLVRHDHDHIAKQ